VSKDSSFSSTHSFFLVIELPCRYEFTFASLITNLFANISKEVAVSTDSRPRRGSKLSCRLIVLVTAGCWTRRD
jgi:hypothetical protein